MRLTEKAEGVYAIAATPFEPDGRLDTKSIDTMVDFYRAAGVDGLTILGIMGEAPKLDADESVAVVKQIVKRAGRHADHRRRLGAGLCRHARAGPHLDGLWAPPA